ncbi:hypothetical protein T484DRAFT_1629722, partial [Baffinella frigidus]
PTHHTPKPLTLTPNPTPEPLDPQFPQTPNPKPQIPHPTPHTPAEYKDLPPHTPNPLTLTPNHDPQPPQNPAPQPSSRIQGSAVSHAPSATRNGSAQRRNCRQSPRCDQGWSA